VALVQARQKLVHDALDVRFTEPVLGVQEAGQVVLHVLFDQNELVCTWSNQECVVNNEEKTSMKGGTGHIPLGEKVKPTSRTIYLRGRNRWKDLISCSALMLTCMCTSRATSTAIDQQDERQEQKTEVALMSARSRVRANRTYPHIGFVTEDLESVQRGRPSALGLVHAPAACIQLLSALKHKR
jgi:hypothetical protein